MLILLSGPISRVSIMNRSHVSKVNCLSKLKAVMSLSDDTADSRYRKGATTTVIAKPNPTNVTKNKTAHENVNPLNASILAIRSSMLKEFEIDRYGSRKL